MNYLKQRLAMSDRAAGPPENYTALLGTVRERLLSQMQTAMLMPQDPTLIEATRREATLVLQETGSTWPPNILEKLVADLAGFGPIQPLIDDPAVTEIMVNSALDVWAERDGKLMQESRITFPTDEAIRDLCTRIAIPLRRRIDEANPILDGRLPDGSRISAILSPISLGGTLLTVRKFKPALTAERLVGLGAFSPELLLLLQLLVQARCNTLVVGATSSGKTSLLNALSSFIPADERIVTIEDAAELRLQQPHVVRLETRPTNVEGKGEVTVRDLVRAALRLRPDRIVVGEVRGAEALDMVQAHNTGHDGCFSTLHANSPADALARLETMVLLAGSGLPAAAVRRQIGSAFDLIVQVSRGPSGRRRVVTVAEVHQDGADPTVVELLTLDPVRDRLVRTPEPPRRLAMRCRHLGPDRLLTLLNATGGEPV